MLAYLLIAIFFLACAGPETGRNPTPTPTPFVAVPAVRTPEPSPR